MKKNILEKMFHDPDMDPTSWMCTALLEYASKHFEQLISDEISRSYVFEGMESDDLHTISKAVVESYRDSTTSGSPNIKIIDEFVTAINSLKDSSAWERGYAFRELERVSNPETVGSLIRMDDPGREPNETMSFLTFDHIKSMFHRWKIRWSSSLTWQAMLDRLSFSQIKTLLQDENPQHRPEWGEVQSIHPMKSALENNYDRNWPYSLQNILWYIFIRVPDHELYWWNNFLDELKLGRTYTGSTLENFASKGFCNKHEDYSDVSLNQPICRCGFISSRPSGLSFHQSRSNEDECQKVGLRLAAKITLAAYENEPLTCTGCGKAFKSKSGYTLHSKKCEETLLADINEERDLERTRERLRADDNTTTD